jgi:hypothetical protein
MRKAFRYTGIARLKTGPFRRRRFS